MAAQRPTSLILIVGDGRSGSTLLERLLGANSNTTVVGEVGSTWTYGFAKNHLCSCGEPFLSCPFWTAVRAEVTARAPAFAGAESMLRWQAEVDRYRLLPAMHRPRLRPAGFADGWRAYRANLGAWYGAIGQIASPRVIIDSSKDPCFAHVLSTIPTLDILYVHLVRDSRAVAYSWSKKKAMPHLAGRVQAMPQKDMSKTAIMWNVKFATSRWLSSRHPGRVVEVGYEALARHPEQVIASIRSAAQRVGLPDLGTPERDVALSRYHSASGNPMRFNRAPLTVHLDDEWRRQMPRRDQLMVTALSAPFLAKYRLLERRQGAMYGRTAPH